MLWALKRLSHWFQVLQTEFSLQWLLSILAENLALPSKLLHPIIPSACNCSFWSWERRNCPWQMMTDCPHEAIKNSDWYQSFTARCHWEAKVVHSSRVLSQLSWTKGTAGWRTLFCMYVLFQFTRKATFHCSGRFHNNWKWYSIKLDLSSRKKYSVITDSERYI